MSEFVDVGNSVVVERSESDQVCEIELRNPVLAGFLSWVIPGLGHVYQGRCAKGLLFFFMYNAGVYCWLFFGQ
jgi:hypothetical protein